MWRGPFCGVYLQLSGGRGLAEHRVGRAGEELPGWLTIKGPSSAILTLYRLRVLPVTSGEPPVTLAEKSRCK